MRYGIILILVFQFFSVAAFAQDKYLTVGVEPKNDALSVAEKWIPFLKDLSDLSGVKLRFRTSPNVLDFNRAISGDEFDLIISSSYLNSIFTQKYGLETIAKFKQKHNSNGLALVVSKDRIADQSNQKVTVAITKDNRHQNLQTAFKHLQLSSQSFVLITFNDEKEVLEAVSEGLNHYGVIEYADSLSLDAMDIEALWVDENIETIYLSAQSDVKHSDIEQLRIVLSSINHTQHWYEKYGISPVNAALTTKLTIQNN